MSSSHWLYRFRPLQQCFMFISILRPILRKAFKAYLNNENGGLINENLGLGSLSEVVEEIWEKLEAVQGFGGTKSETEKGLRKRWHDEIICYRAFSSSFAVPVTSSFQVPYRLPSKGPSMLFPAPSRFLTSSLKDISLFHPKSFPMFYQGLFEDHSQSLF